MKKYLLLVLSLGVIGSASAGGIDTNAVIGGAIGGGTGAAVGSAVGGRNGAIVGSAIGAAAGVAIATPKRSKRTVYRERVVRREYDDDRYEERHHHHPHGRARGWHRNHDDD